MAGFLKNDIISSVCIVSTILDQAFRIRDVLTRHHLSNAIEWTIRIQNIIEETMNIDSAALGWSHDYKSSI